MYYFDNLIARSFINVCESVGNLFMAQFIGVDSFWMGLYILILLLSCIAGIMIPAGGKKHVR